MNEHKTVNALLSGIEAISTNHSGLFSKDFLVTWEKGEDDLRMILEVASVLKQMREGNISPRIADSGLAVSIFRDKSTRTRFAFASACNLLGFGLQELDEEKSQIAHGETVRETAAMISFLTDFIGIRDDQYLGEGNRYMRELAAAIDDSHSNGILPARPGIINLQCDMDHPTQTMADLMHLKEVFGSLDALRGKKFAMSWAYSPSYGKPLSVPQGIIALMTRLGMDVSLSYPEGYDLVPEIVEMSQQQAKSSGGSLQIFHSMEEAMTGAHIVYPKSWAPLHIMKKRTELLNSGETVRLRDLEQECLNNNKEHIHWEYDQRLQSVTDNGSALYLHCLPADISGVSCHRGEVDASVFEQARLQTYREAGYKPYIIAAVMFCYLFRSPAGPLRMILERNNARRYNG